MARYQEDGKENRGEDRCHEEKIAQFKDSLTQDKDFRVAFVQAIAADNDCVAILWDSLLAALHEAFGAFAIKKVLQIGGALLLGLFAWLAAKGYISVKLP